jgi:SAM-dependent methyltransferase
MRLFSEKGKRRISILCLKIMKDFFDRKTFDPENNAEHKSILNVLRNQGRIRRSKMVQSSAMKWALKKARSGTFLDLGCGDSPDAEIAARLGFTTVASLDLFKPEKPFNFTYADVAEAIPFADNSVDVAISQAMVDLIEPSERANFYREVNRVLKAGGIFACYLQWLQSGYGFDLDEECLRAESVWGKIKREAQGFLIIKGENL